MIILLSLHDALPILKVPANMDDIRIRHHDRGLLGKVKLNVELALVVLQQLRSRAVNGPDAVKAPLPPIGIRPRVVIKERRRYELIQKVISRHARIRPELQKPLIMAIRLRDHIAAHSANMTSLQLRRIPSDGVHGGPYDVGFIRPSAPRRKDRRVTSHNLHLGEARFPRQEIPKQPLEPITILRHRTTSLIPRLYNPQTCFGTPYRR